MLTRRKTLAGIILAGLVCVAAGVAWKACFRSSPLGLKQPPHPKPVYIAVHARIDPLMSTRCELTAVVPEGQLQRASDALAAAETLLRQIEATMNANSDEGEVPRFNRSPAGKYALSPELLDLLRQSRSFHQQTRGAFDITIRPLITLWKAAGREQRLPTDSEIAAARAASSWDALNLLPDGAAKSIPTVCIDLGGIAKKHAIDRAAESLRAAGMSGGLVNIGGDIRCFGRRVDDGAWRIGIQDPFHNRSAEPLAILLLHDQAACTSGNYERFQFIAGKRYSHIVDPATGRPADAAASVTVVGPAALSGVWATALSILGAPGLELLPRDLQAMVIIGDEASSTIHMTEGFPKLLDRPLQGKITTRTAP